MEQAVAQHAIATATNAPGKRARNLDDHEFMCFPDAMARALEAL